MNFPRLSVLLLVFISPSQRGWGSEAITGNDHRVGTASHAELLISETPLDRFEEIKRLKNQRSELIGKLIGIVEGSYSNELRREAVFLLGIYRAPEAVPVLVKNLDLDDHVGNVLFSDKDFGDFHWMNVRGALIKIGMPAIPRLLDKIIETDDAKLAWKCVSICKEIEELEVTQFRLERLLRNETNPKKKARLKSSLQILKTFPK